GLLIVADSSLATALAQELDVVLGERRRKARGRDDEQPGEVHPPLPQPGDQRPACRGEDEAAQREGADDEGGGGHGDVEGARELREDRRDEAVPERDEQGGRGEHPDLPGQDRKSTRLNSSHVKISYAVFCLKKKIK